MDKMNEEVKWVLFCNYPTIKVKTTVFEEYH